MRNILSVMAVLLPVVSAFCDHGTTLFPRASGDPVKVAQYGFDGIRGPLNWHGLNKTANYKCAKGREQSPIDISTSSNKTVRGSSLNFNIDSYPDGAELLNLGSTLEVVANGSISLANKTFNLAQFHFHTPSEHHLDGEYYPAEMHCVFQAQDKSISVVGFFIELDENNNEVIDGVFEHVDAVATPGTAGYTGALDFRGLQKHLSNSDIYQYKGSLTTPPCTEGIRWNVVRKPITIDMKTFKKIKSIMKFNARYVQNVPGQINLLENAAENLE
ncbi:hypothetical protein MCOR25_006269 [Pyricularia grisea]|uniref:carbonic anhydrase n=1 Tax=Pyricularia grisea TaxID=148305 RepID=A0A6P8BIL0_PYRGI|nr:uncharacterized protein PgNI_01337 [Pyricularia grisea]KAI6362196.1 hypothetical protein MCOR25_006269 [Pyricularia grisea]TLD16608.1 hypothetical protein PgNI_01337 [Pyricularia grisea]